MVSETTQPYALGFVMEQVLGHRTHYRNLRRFVEADSSIAPTWMPIEFAATDRISRLPGVRSNWSARASWGAWDAVRRARRNEPLEAVFYHSQVTSLLAPWQRALPTVISLDATPLNYDEVGQFYGHTSGGRLEQLKFRANRHAFGHADALITWCRWARDSLVEDYGVSPEKITVIAPGVDLTQWPRRQWPQSATEDDATRLPRLLFVGGEFERKGGKLLLECFDRGLNEVCELWLVTQTPVEPRPNLRVFNDLTPNSETLLRLYAEADIFVFPSLADCAPLAVPEAMAASLPVIATRVGAIPEMVREGETGLLLDPGDVEQLGVAIESLLHMPQLRRRLGAAGRQLVEAEYDAQRNAQRLLDVLRGVVDDRRQARSAPVAVPVGARATR